MRAAGGMLLLLPVPAKPLRQLLLPPLLLFLLLFVAAPAHSLPIQYLPEIPGYIPVYIRYGDQPLREINPALAEAFNEPTDISKDVPLNELGPVNLAKDLTDRNDVALDSKEDNLSSPMLARQLFYSLPEKKDPYAQKSKPSGRESVVMKIARPTYPDKVDIKKTMKESKHKDGNK